MRKIILCTLLLIGLILSTSAQQIEPLYRKITSQEPNTYYKDLYNDLDPFVGTWMYTDGNTSLTITLQKKTRASLNTVRNRLNYTYYEDMLVGGYKYTVNGSTLVNTLPLLDNNYTDPTGYTLYGSGIMGPYSVACVDCGPNTRRVTLNFYEPNRDVWVMLPQMEFERVDEGGLQKVRMIFITTATATQDSPTHIPEHDDYSIPLGTYVLTRQ